MSAYTPPSFKSRFIPHPLSPTHRIHVVTAGPPTSSPSTPILLIHGLGGSASFWLPALSTAQGRTLSSERQVYAIDAYGHGISDFVSEEDSLDRAAEAVGMVIEHLLLECGKEKIVLVGHSMSGLVTSLVAARRPNLVEKLFLLSPALAIPPTMRESLRARSKAVFPTQGHLDISTVVSTTGISLTTHRNNPLAAPFIKHLIVTTKPESYSQACKNLASHPGWNADVGKLQCQVFILSGSDDYMVSVAEIKKRAEQVPDGKGTYEIMQDVGHWGGLELPEKVARMLLKFVKQ